MTSSPGHFRRAVVVGGTGAVGGLFADRLRDSGVEVSVVDSSEPGTGDITAICPELADRLCTADLVLLAVPEPVAFAALDGVTRALRPDALLADTLSVKGPFVTAARKHRGGEMLSLNPMFAPALGFDGRPVAAVTVRAGPRADELLRLLKAWGSQVVEVSEDEHDRLAGATQALTHATVLAFGLALGEFGVGIAEVSAIAPPPHKTLLSLLARIASGTPEVYWDVQAANPHAPAAREALSANLHRLGDLVDSGDEVAFGGVLTDLREFFGPELAHYQELCARTFHATA